MRHTLGRRLLAGAAAAVAAGAFATPARAATPDIDMTLTDVTVAAGGNTLTDPILVSSAEAELTNGKITYELSGLSGVSLHTPKDMGEECTEESATKITCPSYFVFVGPYLSYAGMPAQVEATAEALGQTGKITATFEADGVKPVTRSAALTVAEGVDLAAGKSSEVTVKPGAKFNAPLSVLNNTDKTVHGTAVILDTDYAFAAAGQFGNCYYIDDQMSACVFDQELEPGVSYQIQLPYRLRADTAAPGNAYGEFEWLTTGDWDDLLKFIKDVGYGGPGKLGTGDNLLLTPEPKAKALNKQTDTNPDNNWQDVTVNTTGKQGTDFQAIGATVTGAAGDTVTVNVGVRNNGPATLDRSRAGEPAATVIVTIPTGTAVVDAPAGCTLATGDDTSLKTKKGGVQYGCFSDYVFPAKTTVTWPFRLKITKVQDDATGWVESNPPCECDRFDRDTNKANDVAKIVVNPVAAGGGEGGGDGDGLPITGPQTALIAAAGAILVAAGAVLMMRRRRTTRFEA